jgi:transcriptional regulator with XRE-family HTH domain
MASNQKSVKVLNNPFNYESFSEAVTKKRLKENLFQKTVAKQLKIAQGTVFNAESGKAVKIEYIITLCNWLEVPITHFMKPKK